MHYLNWEHSRLNIRCWQCSNILVTISTNGSSLNFKSNVEYLEINCPICHTTCEYSLIEKDDGLFKSHDWDSEIGSLDFDGQTGEVNRNLLRQYRTLLLAGEASKKFMENEFYIVGDYKVFLIRHKHMPLIMPILYLTAMFIQRLMQLPTWISLSRNFPNLWEMLLKY